MAGGPSATGRPIIIWDLDGTLVDSSADIAEAANACRLDAGLPALPLAIVRGFIGDGQAALLRRMLPEADAGGMIRATTVFRRAYADGCTRQTVLYPGMAEVLERLHAHHHHLMAVATNKPLAFSLRILAHLRLSRYFADVQGGDGPKKPDPLQLHTILRLLHGDPSRSWMVGDHHTDLHAGHAAGLRTLHVTWGIGHPDGARCDAVAHAPADLIRHLG